jgi:hypothetical protein
MLRFDHAYIGNAYIFEPELLADMFLGCDRNKEADFFVALTFRFLSAVII